MRRVLIGVVIALAAIASYPATIALGGADTHGPPTTTQTTGGGHDPVTICHKPGTPAEMQLTVDDSSILDAHLMHGDTLGPCPIVTTTTETTEPPECPNGDLNGELPGCDPVITVPPPSGDCPPGMVHDKGHDGNEGNDDCCFPGVDCDGDTPPPPTDPGTSTSPPTTVMEPPVTTTQPPVTEPPVTETVSGNPPFVTAKPPKKPKPDKAPTAKRKVRPVHICKPGEVETKPCGVQGSG